VDSHCACSIQRWSMRNQRTIRLLRWKVMIRHHHDTPLHPFMPSPTFNYSSVMGGTPTEIADEMEAWYATGAADGFNLMLPLLPNDWLNFAELVVPELQRRGLTRQDYAGGTLRDRLGLPRPTNRFSSKELLTQRGRQRL
jgi:hypothetical protein